jgi:hypothetical protein
MCVACLAVWALGSWQLLGTVWGDGWLGVAEEWVRETEENQTKQFWLGNRKLFLVVDTCPKF